MNYRGQPGAPWQLLAIVASLAAACGSPASGTTQGAAQAGTTGSTIIGANGPVAGGSTVTAPIAGGGSASIGAITTVGAGGSPAAVGGTGAAGVGGSGAPAVSGKLPCAVSAVLITNCQKCHGATPSFGAPMPLVTFADLQAPLKSDPTKKVFAQALVRLNDKAKPMPPGGSTITDADRATLTTWLTGGGLTAPDTQTACDTSKVRVPHDEAYFKTGLTPLPGETCYNIQVHGGQTVGDTTPYPVKTGEHYEAFYFKVPWSADEVMTRYGGKFDNLKVVHHWLLFTSSKAATEVGKHEDTIGTTIGDTSQLIAGWAVGGDNVVFPPDTALQLSADGILNAQWHYNNATGAATMDSSEIQVCTMKKTDRKNIASLTFLGTENFNGPIGMPAKTMSKFTGTCLNDSMAPITIIGFNPHMHKLGRHMNTVIKRSSGMMETVFDNDFDFANQVTYILDTPIVLAAGESIISTCTFDNETSAAVPFGPSTTQEMCYNFTMSYPAKALDNGVASLIGATNTCW